MRRRDSRELFLHEELMLLALRDEEGTPPWGSMHAYAIAGGVLAELLLMGRVALEDGKKQFVRLVGDQSAGDPVLDEHIDKIAAAKRRAGLSTWIMRFASNGHLHHDVAQGLCELGILQADEQTVLLLFKRRIYPELDPRPERELIERLRKAIFQDSPDVAARTAILISLAKGAGLLQNAFARKELKQRKKRIEQLCAGEPTGRAAGDAVQAAHAAAAAAACVVVMCASS